MEVGKVKLEKFLSTCDVCFKSESVTTHISSLGRTFRMLLTNSNFEVTEAYLDSMKVCHICLKSLQNVAEFRDFVAQNQILDKADELYHLRFLNESAMECCICLNKKMKLFPIEELQSIIDMIFLDMEIEMLEECLNNKKCCEKCHKSLINISELRNFVIEMISQQFNEEAKDDEGDGDSLCEQAMVDSSEGEEKGDDSIEIYSYCRECDKTFKSPRDLKSHLKYTVKHAAKHFKCSLCDARFFFRKQLTDHVVCAHGDGITKISDDKRKVRHCPFCEKLFPLPYGVTHHLQRAHNLPNIELVKRLSNCKGGRLICHICDQVCRTFQKLRLHYIQTHKRKKKEPQGVVQCNECNKIYKTKGLLNVHIKQVHDVSTNKDSYCEECDMQFKNLYLLKAHRRHSTKHAKKKFKCSLCGEMFLLKSVLEGHVRYAHENKGDQCLVCDKICPPPHGLTQHLRRVHDLPNLKNENESRACHMCGFASQTPDDFYLHFREIHGGVNPIKCEKCESVFHTRWSYNIHKREAHRVFAVEVKKEVESDEDQDGSMVIKIESEDPSIEDINHLNNRKLVLGSKATRQRRFICDKCNTEYKSRYGILHHLRYSSAHAVKNFACHICGKKFMLEKQLHTHISFKHEGIGGFLCPQCGKRCCTAGELSTHMAFHRKSNYSSRMQEDPTSDSFNKPKKCEECGKVLKNAYCYKVHLKLMHATKKEEAHCWECDKDFRNRKQLRQHLTSSVNHAVKKFECSQCTMKFISKPLLEGHIQFVHENKGHPCPICLKVFPPPYALTKHMKRVHFNSKKYVNINDSMA